VDDPEGIVTVAGTETAAELLEMDTTAPAADVSETVHVDDFPAGIVVGAHTRAESWGDAISVNEVVCVEEPRVAVIVAVSLDPVGAVLADAWNVAVAAPAGTVTEAGTDNLESLETSATAAPFDPVAWESVTVQVAVAGASSVAGLQESALITGATGFTTVMFAPLPLAGSAVPAAAAATTPAICTPIDEDGDGAV
jgi:hypothetical protein